MRLGDLFSGGQSVNDNTRSAAAVGAAGQTGAGRQAAAGNRLQNLTPGQTIQGDVVSKNGNEVQIRTPDDQIIHARLEHNMNLEVGKTVTFEVRNNGRALTLSPLFENTAADPNVTKALSQASLPINGVTVSMTEQMMKAGMSVDRNSLQQMFREVGNFPQADVSDIVDLHRLSLPVNESNLAQIESYKNLTHQLIGGMQQITGQLPDVIAGMLAEGDVDGAARLYQELLELVSGSGGELAEAESAAGEAAVGETVAGEVITGSEEAIANPPGTVSGAELSEGQTGAASEVPGEAALAQAPSGGAEPDALAAMPQAGAALGKTVFIAEEPVEESGVVREKSPGEAAKPESVLIGESAGKEDVRPAGETGGFAKENIGADFLRAIQGNPEPLKQAEHPEQSASEGRQRLAAAANELIGTLPLSEEQQTGLRAQLAAFAGGELSDAQSMELAGQLLKLFADQGEKGRELTQMLLRDKEILRLPGDALEKAWTIRPEELRDADTVESLYRHLNRQLKGLSQALASAGQSESQAAQSVTNLSQNVDFLQQVNQMYTYVQLPLRFQDGEAHGDLYVYTNKKNLARKDGNVSALLHLDMEHLGPVDVYVAMQSERVSTRFYVQDEEMLDFLNEHMDLLTKRLQKRGYSCSCEMTVRSGQEAPGSGEKTGGSGIGPLLDSRQGLVLAQYSFDVRA